MPHITKYLVAAYNFLIILTWKKLAQLLVFIFIIFLGLSMYETRETIYNFAVQNKLADSAVDTRKLSKKTTDEIDLAVNNSDLIITIQVVMVDFQRNVRYVIYVSTKNSALKAAYAAQADNSIGDLPLFSSNTLNNVRLVNLINGEFVCNLYADTPEANTLGPAVSQYVNTVCSSGIPPFYAKFSGLIHIFTSRKPTTDEYDQIRILAKKLSASIYDRDFR